MLDVIRPLKKGNHKVLLTEGFRKDITWWLEFLPVFNSRGIRPPQQQTVPLVTDACNQGGGMICPFDWAYVNWKLDMPSMSTSHINVKETMAVILSIYRWAPLLRGRHVVVYTDNMTTRAAVNKGISKDPRIMSHLLKIFWLRNLFNFTIKAVHIKGALNIYADSASRLHSRGHFLHWLSVCLGHVPSCTSAIWHNMCMHMSYKSLCHLFLQHQTLFSSS